MSRNKVVLSNLKIDPAETRLTVSARHDAVLLSRYGGNIDVYSLSGGAFRRTIGRKGNRKLQFDGITGMCMCPNDDMVLVAEHGNSRIQWLRIAPLPSWQQTWPVKMPVAVCCSPTSLVVAREFKRRTGIQVFGYTDKTSLACFSLYDTCPDTNIVKFNVDAAGIITLWNRRWLEPERCHARQIASTSSGKYETRIRSSFLPLKSNIFWLQHCSHSFIACLQEDSVSVELDTKLVKLWLCVCSAS